MKLTRIGNHPEWERIGYKVKIPAPGYSFVALTVGGIASLLIDTALPSVIFLILMIATAWRAAVLLINHNVSPLEWDYLSHTVIKIPSKVVLCDHEINHPVMKEAMEDYKADQYKDKNKSYWLETFENIAKELDDMENVRIRKEFEQTQQNRNYVEQIKEERKFLGLDN